MTAIPAVKDNTPHPTSRKERRRQKKLKAAKAKPRVYKTAAIQPTGRGDRETVIPVELYGGRGVGTIISESDPDGTITTHVVRKDADVIDRLLDISTIDRQLWQAGDQFRKDFNAARLAGHYVTVNLMSSAHGKSDIADNVVQARRRVEQALAVLGRGARALSVQAAWHVIGEQQTLDEFAQRCRLNGVKMNADKASGVVIGMLERLAVHFGTIKASDLRNRQFRAGIEHSVDGIVRRAETWSVQLAERGDHAGAKALMQFASALRPRNTA